VKALKRIRVSGYCLAALIAVMGFEVGAALADDAANAKIIEYYRRKSNLPPEVEIKVTDITDAKIAGAKTATLTMARGGQVQKTMILMSPDGRYVVFGELEDVTADPFKAIAAKIKTDGMPTRGPKDAKVTIVEYSDFQCPYCARAHATVADQVMKEYDGKVKLVYKNFPLGFHPWAEPAAVAGLCAFEQDPQAFWKLYDYYFKAQQQLNPQNIKEKSAEELKGTKVNMDKWNDCVDNKKTLAQVKADMAEGQSVGVTGTPAFLINGRKISGAQPFQNFKAIIDDELARSGGKS
jgi:protein-disulfide isomerase